MQSVADIFALWRSDADLGRDIGLPYPTVAAWKQRGSIPAAYWRDLIRAAQGRGHLNVTADLLAELHARKRFEGLLGFAEDEPAKPMPTPQEPVSSNGLQSPGQFSRWGHLRRAHFASKEEINSHVRALREEWDRR
jgi:hypothetical protein